MDNERVKKVIEKHYIELFNEINHHIVDMLGKEQSDEWTLRLHELLKEQREKLELRLGV